MAWVAASSMAISSSKHNSSLLSAFEIDPVDDDVVGGVVLPLCTWVEGGVGQTTMRLVKGPNVDVHDCACQTPWPHKRRGMESELVVW